MKPLTAEWVAKAEADFRVVEWLVRAPEPVYDAVGFHAQQCIEKYLKARLQEVDIAFSRTHDLEALLDLVLPVEGRWAEMRPDLAFLSRFAVESRYPGIVATAADASDAMRMCAALRRTIRQSLGLNA